MKNSDLRAVIVAEHASAQFGGEALLPLQYFRLLRARKIETWLVVHARTKVELESIFPEDSNRILFVADTWLHRLLNQGGKVLPRRVAEVTMGLLSHLYTQTIQRGIVKKLVQEHKINIVHQPIPVSPKYPSLIFGVGAPVVIGPLNGGIEFPPAFRSYQSKFVELTIVLGRRISNLCNRILSGKLKAQMLLVANQRTKQALPAGVSGKIIELVENGVDLSVWRSVAPIQKQPNKRVHFVYVGRLVDWKAVDLLLEAFQPVAVKTGAVLEIIGDGVQRQELEHQSVRLGLTKSIVFTGWLSQEQCAVKLRQADALVLPSLLECGGAVILEAMAMGLPVIATNWGGPADYIDSSCGILIEPTSRTALVSEITNAMMQLALSPNLRQKMGLAGQKRVRQDFNWDRKINEIIKIYRQAIADWQGKVFIQNSQDLEMSDLTSVNK